MQHHRLRAASSAAATARIPCCRRQRPAPCRWRTGRTGSVGARRRAEGARGGCQLAGCTGKASARARQRRSGRSVHARWGAACSDRAAAGRQHSAVRRVLPMCQAAGSDRRRTLYSEPSAYLAPSSSVTKTVTRSFSLASVPSATCGGGACSEQLALRVPERFSGGSWRPGRPPSAPHDACTALRRERRAKLARRAGSAAPRRSEL